MANVTDNNSIKIKINQTIMYSNNAYKGAFEYQHDLWNITAIDGDYADLYETNTRWRYRGQYNMWENTRQPIAYNRNLQANELPEDCSFTDAKVGNSERFAREDHVHKIASDTNKADKSVVDELSDNVINNTSDIEAIESKIPTQATAQNQLADKDFVNSSIINMAARYITPTSGGDEQWQSLNALQTGPWFYQGESVTPTRNDYAIFLKGEAVWRGIYDGTQWDEQYQINNSSFTAEQLAVLNSGITEDLVNAYNVHIADRANPHNVTATQVGLGNVVNERQYSEQNPPDYPVTSVAGKTGDVTLDVADVNNAFSKNGGTIDGNVLITDANLNFIPIDGQASIKMRNKDVITYLRPRDGDVIVVGSPTFNVDVEFNTHNPLKVYYSETDTAQIYDSKHQPPYPVTSVNGRKGMFGSTDVLITTYGSTNVRGFQMPWSKNGDAKLYHTSADPMMNGSGDRMGYVNWKGFQPMLQIEVADAWGDVRKMFVPVHFDYFLDNGLTLTCPYDPSTVFDMNDGFYVSFFGGEFPPLI